MVATGLLPKGRSGLRARLPQSGKIPFKGVFVGGFLAQGIPSELLHFLIFDIFFDE